MNQLETFLAVLGGGPAGYVAAIRAAQLGASIVLIEEKELGGVCLNQGCIPTKTFLQNSAVMSLVSKSREYGIENSASRIDWSSAWFRKERVVKSLRQGINQLMVENTITVIRGKGHIVTPSKIIVMTEEGEQCISCQKILIAVGSEPSLPNIPGIDQEGVMTSNEALELTDLPESLIILGAGVIGLEFAEMFQQAGTKVTVIEEQDRILYQEDQECSEELYKILKRSGIVFKLGTLVQKITKENVNFQMTVLEKGKEAIYSAPKILVATGRKPRTKMLGLENIGLNLNNNGAIQVDDTLETTCAGIYAAGDVTGGRQLAHLAFAQGKCAVENVLGLTSKINNYAVPSCIYTHPELATVGMTEAEAISYGIPIQVGRFFFRQNGRALANNQRDGFVKIMMHKDSHIILGGQILGEQASEMISELTLAIALQAKAEIIADMIHPHPTLSEAVMEACADAVGRSIHKSRK
ncbi:dihydrolipoyl dehydrogenase [Dehalobacter sp. DCM]|uniref:dihydrolipoyl dehydrogenase n=1 Tax=Dehalobacter sp. DCM TaxID=2907827 RepID=UPI0030818B1A|nr:dihydrolipoyl dehydrogenase [Dehalobacter sp. DCM]